MPIELEDFGETQIVDIDEGKTVGIWRIPQSGTLMSWGLHVLLNGDANADYAIDQGVPETTFDENNPEESDVHWFEIDTVESVDEIREEYSWHTGTYLRLRITAGTGQADTAAVAVTVGA